MPLGAACPLCQGSLRKSTTLYGHPVCKKCSYKFANRRQGAWIIDAIILYIAQNLVTFVIFSAIVTPSTPRTERLSVALAILSLAITISSLLIFYLKDGFRGASPGKMVTGIQVVDASSFAPISFTTSFKRNIPLLIPLVPLVAAIQLNKGPRLGDKWANTKVIWKKFAHTEVFAPSLACEKCGYSLQGNVTGTCPECGQPVSARNLETLGLQPPAVSNQ